MTDNVNMFSVEEHGGRLTVSIVAKTSYCAPKIKVTFTDGEDHRILPLLTKEIKQQGGEYTVTGSYIYTLDRVFFEHKAKDTFATFYFDENGKSEKLYISPENATLCSGTKIDENGNLVISSSLMNKKSHIRPDELKNREVLKYVIRRPIIAVIGLLFNLYRRFNPVVKNRVTFMSGRRTELGGNSEFVYNCLKDNKDIEIRFLLFEQKTGFSALKNMLSFLKLYATSRVVIVDDFFRMLNLVKKPDDIKLIQLWHACGAFKTFGFSRLGKAGGPLQISKSHRMYDYTFVSSSEVEKYYAEGFGISQKKVISLGVPRTDVLFDEKYKTEIREKLYSAYPQLKGKKVVLFAPTFRGNGQQSAYYPADKLDVNRLAESLGEDYAVIIKLHPFCKEPLNIKSEYKNRVLDLSLKDEINDLLFITDILITDYSSVVFEASALNIPMLFYAYDLEEYIEGRDFYYEYKSFIPGPLVRTQDELEYTVKNGSYSTDVIDAFKRKFFNVWDGASSKRAAELIVSLTEVNQ